MAARQDQGLQIGMIGSIFLFIVSFVIAYVYWKSYTDSEQRVATLTSQLAGEQQASRTFKTEKETLQTIMGFGPNDTDVEKVAAEDMAQHGAGLAEDRRSYREVLKTTYQELQSTAAREAEAKQQIKDLTGSLQAVKGESEKQITQFQEAMKKAEADGASLRASFDKDRTALETKQNELMQTLNKQKESYEGELTQRATKITDLEGKLGKAERALKNLIDERDQSTESFEVADGRISWVNQNGTVWINLGEADALRRQITFSVYDGDEHAAAESTKKGSIEVTQILGDHMAEARVTEDSAQNPILTGDPIYSQVWHRGKQLHFALTGRIDVDDDGSSDLQLARDLIKLNGGVVDAYLNEDGKVEGELGVNTRYLVLGRFPERASESKFQDGWSKMNDEAATNGVETITLAEFLNQMGYKPQDRTVRLDAGARAADFPARPEASTLPAGTGAAPTPFRQRTPLNRGNGSRVSATPY